MSEIYDQREGLHSCSQRLAGPLIATHATTGLPIEIQNGGVRRALNQEALEARAQAIAEAGHWRDANGVVKNPSGFTPLDTRIVVEPYEAEKVSPGGIIFTDKVVEREEFATTKARIIAIGSNAFIEWGSAAAKPVAGDSVVIAQYAGKIHEGSDGKKYRICQDSDIMALLEG